MPYFPGISPITLDKVNGQVGVGKTPTVALDVAGQIACSSATFPPLGGERTTTGVSSMLSGLRFISTTTGDMADGFGATIVLGIQDSAAVINNIAAIGAYRDGADNTGALALQAGGLSTKVTIRASGRVGVGTGSPTAWVHSKASTTSEASLCKPHGAVPTSPVNGDEWTTTAGSFVQINGTTKTYVTVSSPATYAPSNVTTDRTYDANATTVEELADILGTLIADLKLTGIIL